MSDPQQSQLGPALATALPGPRSSAYVERLAARECPALTVRRARRAELSGASHDPIVWARAAGCNVWDVDGNRYVDLSAGFGAAALGHSAPEIVAAIRTQSERLVHGLGDLHPNELKVRLLERLCALAPFEDARALLGLSGSDAVSAALKTAALHTKRPGVLAFEGGYHGLEYGPLAACGYSTRFRAPFAAQLNPHVVFARYPSAETPCAHALRELERALDHRDDIGAVMIEPVLGRGGVVVPPPGFLSDLRALCDERALLVIVDEVLTGLGRSGALLRSEADGLRADLVCLGKALGGGMPVSACIGRAEVMAAWGAPDSEALHTGTFFGNALGCAAALATLETLERDGLCERAARVGTWLAERLRERLGARVRAVRGAGLLIGIELDSGARGLALVRALLERGYIVVPAAEDARVVSLTPPLVIEERLLDGFVDACAAALYEVSQ